MNELHIKTNYLSHYVQQGNLGYLIYIICHWVTTNWQFKVLIKMFYSLFKYENSLQKNPKNFNFKKKNVHSVTKA